LELGVGVKRSWPLSYCWFGAGVAGAFPVRVFAAWAVAAGYPFAGVAAASPPVDRVSAATADLLLMTLLQVLLALNINVALLQFLLLLGMFLLHTLALRILLLAQFILFALLLFRHSRIDAVRVGRAVSIRPHIFRRPVSVRRAVTSAGGRLPGRFTCTSVRLSRRVSLRLSARLSGRLLAGRFALSLRRLGAAPRFENSAGRGVAATSGLPWFTEANKARSELAMR